jgi:hypothetical protein
MKVIRQYDDCVDLERMPLTGLAKRRAECFQMIYQVR